MTAARRRTKLALHHTKVHRPSVTIRHGRLPFQVTNMVKGVVLVLRSRQHANLLVATGGHLLFFRQHSIPGFRSGLGRTCYLVTTASYPHELLLVYHCPRRFLRRLVVLTVKVNDTIFRARRVGQHLFTFAAHHIVKGGPFPLPTRTRRV